MLTAGLLQLAMGALRLGRWFRAISVSVVQGMLAGIGLVLIAGQLYAAAGVEAPALRHGQDRRPSGAAGRQPCPARTRSGRARASAPATIALLVLWTRLPKRVRAVPAPLAAVVAGHRRTAGRSACRSRRFEVQGLLDAVQAPGARRVRRAREPGLLGTVLAFTLIASAESLFSAAAVDRLHDGPRTEYDKELMAQGAGNTVCGMLGALPMTAVIVRSSANVQAGARTKASRVLHGVWLLLFAALLPAALGSSRCRRWPASWSTPGGS